MKKPNTSFVFLDQNLIGFARVKLNNGTYSEEVYSVDEITQFMLNSINTNEIKKGTKIDLGKNKDVIYKFNYQYNDQTEEKVEKNQVSIRIPGECRELYKNKEKSLDSLVSISNKINKARIAKVGALMAVGVTLMTFATVKLAKISDKEYELNNKKMQNYVDNLKQEPQVSEYDRLCYEINELENQINSGMIPDVSLQQSKQKLESMKTAKIALEASMNKVDQTYSKAK